MAAQSRIRVPEPEHSAAERFSSTRTRFAVRSHASRTRSSSAIPTSTRVALVGIHTRGVPLAQRLRRLIAELRRRRGAARQLDITFHRDDVRVRGGEAPMHPQPVVRATRLDFPLEGLTCVLVDDVLYTGRTIRAAIEALFDYGRPARVQLAVLVDRGHRELPIRPDYVGKNLPTARGERIQVELVEVDEVDRVLLVSGSELDEKDPADDGSTSAPLIRDGLLPPQPPSGAT